MDKKRITIVFLVVFTNLVGSGVIIPIIPLYAYELLGATEFQSSLVISSFFVAQIFGAAWLGRWSDRIGRRPVLLISQVGTVLSYVILVFAIPLGRELDGLGLDLGISSALVVVYLARILDGVTGGNVSVAQAYAVDLSEPEQRTQVLGIIGGGIGLGFMLGPAYGAWLAGYGLLTPFIGAALITALTLFLTLLFLPESLTAARRAAVVRIRTARVSWRQLLAPRPLQLIMLIALLSVTGFAALQSNLTLYIYVELFLGQPAETVAAIGGYVVAAMGLLAAVGQLVLLKPLLSRLGEQKVVLLGLAMLLLAMLGFDLTAEWSVIAFFGFVVPLAFGYALSQPSLQGLLTRFGDARTNGQLLGYFQSTNSVAYTLGPIVGGSAFQRLGPNAIFLAAALLLLVAAFLGVMLLEREIPL